jgi:CDGSH-type Zn-finger protein
MNKGNLVIILDGENKDRAAEILSINEEEATLRLYKDATEVVEKLENLKRKKLCVCGQSKSHPFCDGSHANG